jgi:hypothetical protein
MPVLRNSHYDSAWSLIFTNNNLKVADFFSTEALPWNPYGRSVQSSSKGNAGQHAVSFVDISDQLIIFRQQFPPYLTELVFPSEKRLKRPLKGHLTRACQTIVGGRCGPGTC